MRACTGADVRARQLGRAGATAFACDVECHRQCFPRRFSNCVLVRRTGVRVGVDGQSTSHPPESMRVCQSVCMHASVGLSVFLCLCLCRKRRGKIVPVSWSACGMGLFRCSRQSMAIKNAKKRAVTNARRHALGYVRISGRMNE